MTIMNIPKQKILKGIGLGIVGLMVGCVSAINAHAAGQAAVYLREGVGARALAMGNAATASGMDASDAYWNPAALPELDSWSLASQTGLLSLDRSWNYLDVVYPGTRLDGKRFALGVGWIGFSAGNDIEARTFNRPEPDYIFEDLENTFLFSAAAQTPAGLNLGFNLKIINQTLDGTSGGGIGFDLAVFHKINDDWQWGMVLQDLYSTINWPGNYQDRLPLLARAGIVHTMLERRLTIAADLGVDYFHAAGVFQEFYYRVGAEYRIFDPFALRVGMDSGRWTIGAGLFFRLKELAQLRLDYALAGEQDDGMGLTHLLSLNIAVLPKKMVDKE